MRRLIVAFCFAGTVFAAAPARADVAPDEPTARREQPGKREKVHSIDAHGQEIAEAEEEQGIVNWWSWDYGEQTTDPSHKGWPPPFGWALVNFVIFIGILSRILWRPLKSGWVARHDQIKSELTEARRLREAAEAKLAEYGKKVANADREVDELLAQLRKEAQADRARMVAAAEAEATRLKEEADRQIKAEIERARDQLRAQAVTAAVAAAREILEKNITGDDQKRLADRYLGELDQVASKATPRAGGAS